MCTIDATLVVFCKRPQPGQGKQRLAQTIGIKAAYNMAEALVAHTCETIALWPGPCRIAVTDERDRSWAEKTFNAPVIIQPEGNLGHRINAIDSILRSYGASQLIFIGTDSPTLSVKDIKSATESLQNNQTVFIPTLDGGVALMGSAIRWPNLHELRWSSEYMFEDIQSICNTQSLTMGILPVQFDIDYTLDLFRLSLAMKKSPALKKHFSNWFNDHRNILDSISVPVSLIIPTYSDVESLSELLHTLINHYPNIHEIIVVDSTREETVKEICTSFDVIWCNSEKGYDAHLRSGASHATGSVLWFLHSDSNPKQDLLASIEASIKTGVEGGSFQTNTANDRVKILELSDWGTWDPEKQFIIMKDRSVFIKKDIFHYYNGFKPFPLFEEIIFNN